MDKLDKLAKLDKLNKFPLVAYSPMIWDIENLSPHEKKELEEVQAEMTAMRTEIEKRLLGYFYWAKRTHNISVSEAFEKLFQSAEKSAEKTKAKPKKGKGK